MCLACVVQQLNPQWWPAATRRGRPVFNLVTSFAPCVGSRVGHLSDLQALRSSSINIAVFPSDERAALTHLVIAGSSAEEGVGRRSGGRGCAGRITPFTALLRCNFPDSPPLHVMVGLGNVVGLPAWGIRDSFEAHLLKLSLELEGGGLCSPQTSVQGSVQWLLPVAAVWLLPCPSCGAGMPPRHGTWISTPSCSERLLLADGFPEAFSLLSCWNKWFPVCLQLLSPTLTPLLCPASMTDTTRLSGWFAKVDHFDPFQCLFALKGREQHGRGSEKLSNKSLLCWFGVLWL